MRTAVTVDDALMAEAQKLTGIHEHSAVVRRGLEALIEREVARRLARLGGSEPAATAPRRRRASR